MNLFYVSTMVEYKDRLAAAMKEAGVSTQALADALKISYQAVKKVVDGKSSAFSTANHDAAARRLGVTSTWLAVGRGAKLVGSAAEPIDLDSHPDIVPIRKVRLRLQAGVSGFGVEKEPNDSTPIFFRADWIHAKGFKADDLIAIKIAGPSMEPNLRAGDVVVINTGDREPKDGLVFAVNYEGESVVKRLLRDAGIWWLASDNADQGRYPRKECREGSCLIIGKVVYRQTEEI